MYQSPHHPPPAPMCLPLEPSDDELEQLAKMYIAQMQAAGLKARDIWAFDQLMTRYEGKIIRHLQRFTKNEETARDLAQETFLAVWLALPTKREGSFRGWLYRIATNIAYGWYRKQGKSVILSLYDFAGEDEEGHELSHVPEQLQVPSSDDQIAEWDVLRQALERLPPKQHACLLMNVLDGLSHKEIANSLGIDEHTVSSNISRARDALRAELSLPATRRLNKKTRRGAS